MNKKIGYKIATGLVLAVGGFYAFRWYKDNYTGFFKKRVRRQDENTSVVQSQMGQGTESSGIYLYDSVTGDVVSQYVYSGNNMSFPLSRNVYAAYDNVAKLQAFLLFANPDNNLAVDGIFGSFTEAAVKQEVQGLLEYNYAVYFEGSATSSGALDEAATEEKYNTITEAYYNEVVLPEFEYFTQAEFDELYGE
tara:strand:- start:6439 stop:7017 length:579 start_codon:yes stop_codon:yes gene_type:complete